MGSVRGVLLDIDGTLVDSNEAHARAWVRAFAEHGIDVPFEAARRRIGMGGDKLLEDLAKLGEDSPQGKALSARRQQLFLEDYVPTLRPFPGARDLIARMRADGLRLVVATSAKGKELNPLLRIIGIEDLISEATSSDDAERSKPDPDIVQAALEASGLPPEQVLMLGDTPYDLEAARRAGVGLVALRCGGWGDNDLKGAVAFYDDPAHLLAEYDSSPFRRG